MVLIKPKAVEQSETAQTSIAQHEDLDAGSKQRTDFYRDKQAYTEDESGFPTPTHAETTFYEKDVNEESLLGKRWDSQSHKFNQLWRLQHGRGHTYEDWGDSHRIRSDDEAQYRRARLVLARADVADQYRDAALQKVMTENLNGFNRYYRGVIGAALGFAALDRYETVGEATDGYLADVAEEQFDVDAEALFEYVWSKYRGDSK
jgi:hypothetical protein